MRILTNRKIKILFYEILSCIIVFILASITLINIAPKNTSIYIFISALCMTVAILIFVYSYFKWQQHIMDNAIAEITNYISGDKSVRISCNEEGELHQLFQKINSLVTILNAQAENELKTKEFLQDTISNISHQLKTPLAALNIYNGILQGESSLSPTIKEFTSLSEQELDRIESLVQNLLKIAKLDAGTIIIEKRIENVSEMIECVQAHFMYRANQEEKTISLTGNDKITLLCDASWLIEALDNIVKNSLDHTVKGNSISIKWKQFSSVVQITIKDNGCGIHPEDIYYIFKRFYRSKFSQDTQGIGLGLPLAKSIIEAHNGTIKVDSELGIGSIFTINFLIPTKL